MTDIEVRLKADSEKIYTGAIKACLPDSAVEEAMRDFSLPKGRLILVAIGKAAWRMAKKAECVVRERLLGRVDLGIVITKYGHSEGNISNFEIYEAGHPVPDKNGISATERVLSATEGLTEEDTVLFLVSGGGSALFESPYCTLEELSALTASLLASGADITEINAVRKHISKVKGGRFAEHIRPAGFFAVVLSDVLGNRIDTIASGPVAADPSSLDMAIGVLERYKIDEKFAAMMRETPKEITNGEHRIGGSVTELCLSAADICCELGYETEIITNCETGFARDVGARLATLAVESICKDKPRAFVIGGETVVRLKGNGLGGRNQEIALSAAPIISGVDGVAVFSVGSDGTDGPTDAAGGYVDGTTCEKMTRAGVDPRLALENNDSYNALMASDGLIFTGPTGTNVNDVAVALVLPREAGRERRFSNLERVLNDGVKEKM